jgi:hypothetical protein
MGQEQLHLQIVLGGVLILGGVFLAELETYFARRHLRAMARQENGASGE